METWRLIEGYEHQYEVSNMGNVRNHLRGRRLSLIEHHTGYIKVNLYNGGIHKQFSVNVLVAKAFKPNPEDKPYTNHKDGNKKNNKASNLEWVTASENTQHAFDTGLCEPPRCQGEDQGQSILKNEDVLEIRRLASKGVKNVDIGDKYNIAPNTVSGIIHHKSWSHLGGYKKPKNGAMGTEVLNEKDVIKIRNIHKKYTQKELAEMFDVSRNTVRRVINRETWTHL